MKKDRFQDTFSDSLKTVMAKMLEIAGHDYDTFDFEKDGWYMRHTMTLSQQEDFRKWLVSNFRSNKQLRNDLFRFSRPTRVWAEEAAGMFILKYGLKVVDDETD